MRQPFYLYLSYSKNYIFHGKYQYQSPYPWIHLSADYIYGPPCVSPPEVRATEGSLCPVEVTDIYLQSARLTLSIFVKLEMTFLMPFKALRGLGKPSVRHGWYPWFQSVVRSSGMDPTDTGACLHCALPSLPRMALTVSQGTTYIMYCSTYSTYLATP